MGQHVSPGEIAPIAAQLALAAVACLAIVLIPQPEGTFLLVPLTRNAANIAATTATTSDAALVARGPLPGSLIVAGKRARLIGPLLAVHILMIAAPATPCGGKAGLLK